MTATTVNPKSSVPKRSVRHRRIRRIENDVIVLLLLIATKTATKTGRIARLVAVEEKRTKTRSVPEDLLQLKRTRT